MNPLTNMKNVKKLSEQELSLGNKTSWHDQYKDSAWIFVGGLPYDLTEGDIICIFSQYGEIVNINLVRDKDTGKQKGFCFVCYEDQRSTVLAVDNLNGIKLLKRTLRVDHVSDYKVPKDSKKLDEETRKLQSEGCGPESTVLRPVADLDGDDDKTTNVNSGDDVRSPDRVPVGPSNSENETRKKSNKKKDKKHKKKKSKKKSKKLKKKSRKESSESDSDSEDSDGAASDSGDSYKKRKIKSEREDSNFNRIENDFQRLRKKQTDSGSSRDLYKKRKFDTHSDYNKYNKNADKSERQTERNESETYEYYKSSK